MSFAEVAKGRVWMGEAAKDAGLVDEVGSFDRAVEIAKELAGIDQSSAVRLMTYPKRVTLFNILVGARNSREHDKTGVSQLPSSSVLTLVFGLLPFFKTVSNVIQLAHAAPAIKSLTKLLPYLSVTDGHISSQVLTMSDIDL
jgi:ClpP class serine protease